jgi:hypothetical protein
MKNFLFIVLSFLVLSPLFSQDSLSTTATDLSKLSEVRKFNNQIDLDVRTLFAGLPSATIIYKRKLERGRYVMLDQIKLLRVTASINTQSNFTPDPNRDLKSPVEVGLHPSNEINVTLGVGLEKQKRSKRFVHYYGADLVGEYYKNDDDYSNGTIAGVVVNATITTDRKLVISRIGVNPFLGIKYYFSPRLSVGVETGFQLAYFNAKIEEYDTKEKVFLEPVISKGIITRFNNLRFLTVGYAF